MTRRNRLRGAEMVEASLVMPVTILITIGLVVVFFAMYERAAVDHQLSTMGQELPDGWQSMADAELARELVLDGSTLDPGRLTVDSATVTEDTASEVRDNDPVATELGGLISRDERRWVTVTATVTYDLETGTGLGPGRVTRTARGTYLVERRWEVS